MLRVARITTAERRATEYITLFQLGMNVRPIVAEAAKAFGK